MEATQEMLITQALSYVQFMRHTHHSCELPPQRAISARRDAEADEPPDATPPLRIMMLNNTHLEEGNP